MLAGDDVSDYITNSNSGLELGTTALFITKCDKVVLQSATAILLQSITKCDRYYKVRRVQTGIEHRESTPDNKMPKKRLETAKSAMKWRGWGSRGWGHFWAPCGIEESFVEHFIPQKLWFEAFLIFGKLSPMHIFHGELRDRFGHPRSSIVFKALGYSSDVRTMQQQRLASSQCHKP